MSLSKLRVLDLFCGAGGLSHGFQSAGFSIIGAYDNWLPAVETYQRNFSHPIESVDIADDTDFPLADVIVGGPPCQGFSSAGLRKQGDTRNSLVSVYANLIAKHRPRAFVFENVEGFLTGESGKHVFELLTPVLRAGYRVHLRKINASNYGVPQHRKRVLAVGGLGWNPTFPLPTHSTHGAPGASLLNGHGRPFAPTIQQALSDLPEAQAFDRSVRTEPTDHVYSPFGEADAQRAAALGPNQRMRDLPAELWHDSYKKRANRRVRDGTPTERRGGAPSGLRRLSELEPSKAITGGALRDFVHPTENRPLTIRECARLQTFPDQFQFSGTLTQKIQLIGNAVPPALARVIATHLLNDLQNAASSKSDGELLSFVPTSSIGMSPILQNVTAEVRERFMGDTQNEQGSLCL